MFLIIKYMAPEGIDGKAKMKNNIEDDEEDESKNLVF